MNGFEQAHGSFFTHMERAIREDEAKRIKTAAFPFPTLDIDQAGKELHRRIEEAAFRLLRARAERIEDHCLLAIGMGCGVRITTYQDGTELIAVDETVPAYTIYEQDMRIHSGATDD